MYNGVFMHGLTATIFTIMTCYLSCPFSLQDLKDVIGEEHHEIIEVLFTSISEYLAQQLHLAVARTRVMVEILSSRNKFAIMSVACHFTGLLHMNIVVAGIEFLLGSK